MHESDNPVPAEAPDVPPVKQGMSRVLLVSLIVNAVLVVGIVVGFLVFQNKMEKTEMEAEKAIATAQTKLVLTKKISDLRDKLGDSSGTRLSDINANKPTYPYSYCSRTFKAGTTTQKEVEAKLLKVGGPMPSVVTEENTVKYKFDYDVCTVTIIVEYEKKGNDMVVKSVDHVEE